MRTARIKPYMLKQSGIKLWLGNVVDQLRSKALVDELTVDEQMALTSEQYVEMDAQLERHLLDALTNFEFDIPEPHEPWAEAADRDSTIDTDRRAA